MWASDLHRLHAAAAWSGVGMRIDKPRFWGRDSATDAGLQTRVSSAMAYHPTSGRDPSRPAFPAAERAVVRSAILRYQPSPKTILPNWRPGLQRPMGPDSPLNFLSTSHLKLCCTKWSNRLAWPRGATGAAIALERDGEMVCRASSGPTAPQLGARLDAASGLSVNAFGLAKSNVPTMLW